MGPSMEKGMLIVTDLAISLLCAAGLFLVLLEDRFRLWVTVACYGVGFLIALGVGGIVAKTLGPSYGVAGGLLVLFAASVFLSRNNFLQKFYVALLALSCHFYLEAFLPPVLGALPFPTAGAFAGVVAVLGQVLLAALLGLCLYHPYQLFSGQGPSAFFIGMSLVQLGICGVANGRVDFLFRVHIPGARLLAATLLFLAVIFAFRSLYQGGQYIQRAAQDASRSRLLDMKAGDYADTLAAVKEAKAGWKEGEYALDTVNVMLQDGNGEMVPRYASVFKENVSSSPLFHTYSENPYLNAVIASKAVFASHNHIHFESNAVTGETPLSTAELCVLTSELLSRACGDAALYDGERNIHFAAFPGEDTLTMEVVYSGELPQKAPFDWKGKTLSQTLAWLFEEGQEDDSLHGLENAREIVGRYSGKLSLSGTSGEVIIHLSLRF